MPDLRRLTPDQRNELAAKACKLAQAGVPATEIRSKLDLTQRTYSRWAKQFGFRACDLRPAKTGLEKKPESADAILLAVEAALAQGDESRADQLLRAWKQTARRAKDIQALESAAMSEAEAKRVEAVPTNQELAAFLTNYAGRTIKVVD